MFQKWFAKYASAVSDEREREWLYKKYRTKTIVSICVFSYPMTVNFYALFVPGLNKN